MSATLSPRDLQCIADAQQWRGGHVEVVDTPDAGRVVVKGRRSARAAGRYTLINTVARLLGVPYLKTAPLLGGDDGQALEVARLRALHAVGARVPRVLHVGSDHFVMQWLGREHLADVLRAAHPQAGALWRQAGQELLRIHAAQQYLSQAFARNMIVSDPPALAGMIDFEDDPLRVMPLADAQVRNWLDYLHSTLWLAPLPVPELDRSLDGWMAAESPAVRERFAHACRRLAWLRALPTHRRWGRDTIALQAAAAAAHRYLRRRSQANTD